MTAYICQLKPNVGGLTLKCGDNFMIVEAADGADARSMAAGHYDGDAKAVWLNPDSCDVSEVAAASDLAPVSTKSKSDTAFELSVVVGGATLNEGFTYKLNPGQGYGAAFSAMVILLNSHADIAGAEFAGDVLTVSSIGDALGDHTLNAEFTYGGVPIPSFLGAVVHEGASGAVLSVATNAAAVLPKVAASGKAGHNPDAPAPVLV